MVAERRIVQEKQTEGHGNAQNDQSPAGLPQALSYGSWWLKNSS